MFIYIGNDFVIESKSIIAIFDAELIQNSRRLLHIVRENKEKETLFGEEENAKSLIMTDDAVYYSSLSTLTLKNRDELHVTTMDE